MSNTCQGNTWIYNGNKMRHIVTLDLYGDQSMYSMKSVAELTGISPDTIRAWEKRYQAINPERESNGRRVYDWHDISRLRLLKNATKLGHSISKIAKLNERELKRLVDEKKGDSEIHKLSYLTEQLMDAIQNYQFSICDEILGLAAAGISPLSYSQNLLSPTLVEVGKLWHKGKINSAQEHLLTSSVKRHLFSLIQVYQRQASGPKLIFSTLNHDRHELGILMCCLIAAGQGFRCYYLGPDLPQKDLIHAVSHIRPRCVVLGIVQSPTIAIFTGELNRLCAEIDDQSEIWIGGAGIEKIEREVLTDRCLVLKTLNDFADQLSYLKVD